MSHVPRPRRDACIWSAICATVLVLSGCVSGNEVPAPPVRPSQLDAALESAQVPPGPLDDYWTNTLGDYLTPDELGRYWLTPADQRFGRWGDRWLEACLREELLAAHRDQLSPEELERFRLQPDYDSSARALQDVLGARKDKDR
ncbi:MAG: hypothetical protein AB7N76_08780 [Planctomycetota bacterium]